MKQNKVSTKVKYDSKFEKKSKKVLNSPILKSALYKRIEIIEKYGIKYQSLTAKKIEPKDLGVWEFYITKKYRCFFCYDEEQGIITILYAENHL